MGAQATIVAPRDLLGPDLAKLPTLEQHLARLDAALTDPDKYAEEFTAVQAELSSRNGNFGCSLFWDTSASDADEPHLYCGAIFCDEQWDQRRFRSDATRDHLPDDPAYRAAIVRLLLSRGHYSDNRHTPREVIDETVRVALSHGVRLMVNPEGRLEAVEGWPATRSDQSKPELEDAFLAMGDLTRLLRRWRAREIVTRIVQLSGASENGWLVMEAHHG